MSVLYLRLSGLIVDVFGDLAVIASSAAWVEKYKQEIEACISRIDEINHINWRPSVEILKEEGINLSDLKEMRPSACPERTKVENPLKHYILLISFLTFTNFFDHHGDSLTLPHQKQNPGTPKSHLVASTHLLGMHASWIVKVF